MTAKEVIDFLNQNWFGFVVSVVTLIVGYRVAKRDKEPYFVMRTTRFISGISSKLPGMTVSYRGEGEGHPINDVSISRFTFWNNGRQVIEKKDVASPIEIQLKGGRILDYAIVSKSHEANGFEVQRNREKDTITLSFNHVDHGEACVVQFVHTGNSESGFGIHGKIKGARFRESILNPQSISILQAINNICLLIILSLGCFGFSYMANRNNDAAAYILSAAAGYGFAILAITFVLILFSMRPVPFGNKEPEAHRID